MIRRRPDRLTLWLGVLALLSVGACGGATDDPEAMAGTAGIALAPTETLLDRVDGWVVASYPETGLPTDIAVSPGEVAASGVLRVLPDEWDQGDALPAAFRRSLELPSDARVYRAVPSVGFRPGVEAPTLKHAGHRLQPWILPDTDYLWRDDDAELIFWWDTAHATLMAMGRWPPGHAMLTQGGGMGGDAARGDGVPVSVLDLQQQMTIGTQTRPGVLVPAPSSLAVNLLELDGTRLHVVVAVAERVYQRDDAGDVLQRLWNQLPVEFAVTAQAGGKRHDLWTRTVTAQDGFIEDVVDLSELPAGPVTLRLETKRGEDTDGNWPFGFWADLSLSGRRNALPTVGMPHVIVIDVDTLRADRLGCYGHWRDTTPRLDGWVASNATLYKDMVAAANWTLPSTASLLTGLSVDQHGMLRYPHVLSDTTPTLGARLRDAGYRTFASVEGGYVSSAFGFDQGFDVFDQQEFQSPRWHDALDWLETRDDGRPAFLFLHTYLTHAPWRADPRFDDPVAPYAGPLLGSDVTHDRVIKPYEAGRLDLSEADMAYVDEMYDASVARLDDYLMDFLERLDTIVPPSERLVIITSDHGEELFGHGRVEHGHSLFGDVLSVPLIVQYPDRPYGRVDLAPASSVDLVPTVFDTLELELPAGLAGRSLREAPVEPMARVAQHADTAHSVQYDGWKLIVGRVAGGDGSPNAIQLYDLHADPGELDDIAEAVPEWVRRLQGMLDEYRQANRPLGPRPEESVFDPAVMTDLERLGYMGGR